MNFVLVYKIWGAERLEKTELLGPFLTEDEAVEAGVPLVRKLVRTDRKNNKHYLGHEKRNHSRVERGKTGVFRTPSKTAALLQRIDLTIARLEQALATDDDEHVDRYRQLRNLESTHHTIFAIKLDPGVWCEA